MSGEHLAWAVTHIDKLLKAAVLGGCLLPLLIAAGITWRQRHASNH
jgi:hypothetical protein